MLVAVAEVVLGDGFALRRCLSVPLDGKHVIPCKSFANIVAGAELGLRLSMPALGRLAPRPEYRRRRRAEAPVPCMNRCQLGRSCK